MLTRSVLLAEPSDAVPDQSGASPLTQLAQRSLLKRSLSSLEALGIQEVLVVVGQDGDAIRREVEADPELTMSLSWLDRRLAHGRAERQLIARKFWDEPALALHAQLLFAPEMLGPLVDRDYAGPVLLVDHKLSRIFDVEPLIKAKTEAGRVLQLGANLRDYDAVAVGMAVLQGPTLEALLDDPSHLTLARCCGQLASGQELEAWDVNGALWQYVDSEHARRHGEWLLRAYGETLHDETVAAKQPPTQGPDPQRTLRYIEGLLNENRAKHYVLMNPGPVLTSARVKSALVHHDVCHRDEDYSVVARRVKRKLRRVCGGGSEHDIVMLSGSGTAAMEATISSCVPRDGKLLVISNGAFGERFAEIAAVHDIAFRHLRYEWGELVDPQAVAAALAEDPALGAVVMCHHETSVGILNPIAAVGAICRQFDRIFFVDAVSSLGGEDLDVRRDNIDVVISSANKCLHAISGVSFACVNKRVWTRIEGIKPRGYYLDLSRYHRLGIPFTPAVSNFFALDAALDELLREGVAGRVRRYAQLNALLREGLERIGLRRMTETGHESHTITTVAVPSVVPFKELYRALKERGFIVYGCKAHLEDRYFQIANMGELSEAMIRGFLDTLQQVLQQLRRRQVRAAV